MIKCIVKTDNDLMVECELTPETIKELKTKNFVFMKKIKGGKN